MDIKKIHDFIAQFNIKSSVKTGPIKVYTAHEIADKSWPDKAHSNRECYFLVNGDSVFTQDGQSIVSLTYYQEGEENARDCFEHAQKQGMIDAKTEVRLFDSPSLKARALWLKKGDDNIFIPYGNLKLGTAPKYAADPDFTAHLIARIREFDAARKNADNPDLSGG